MPSLFHPPMMPSVTSILLILLLGMTGLEPARATALEPEAVDEYRAKAALLYVFAKFVTWPEDTFLDDDAPFVFGIVGKNPFGSSLDDMCDKRIHGRRVEIRYFPSVGKFEPCHLLFCSSGDLHRFSSQYPDLLDTTHVLTVGEGPGFAEGGGILHLTFVNNHLAYRINIDAARRAKIEVSAKLFELAAKVVRDAE